MPANVPLITGQACSLTVIVARGLVMRLSDKVWPSTRFLTSNHSMLLARQALITNYM